MDILRPFLFSLALLLALATPAHAYLDAGSGSYVLQLALAGVLAAGYTLKVGWRRARGFLAALFGRRPALPARSDE